MKIIASVLLFSLFCLAVFSIDCLDESGNAVDWFFMYKMGSNVNMYGGFTYAYTDSKTSGKFALGDIRKNTNAVARTITNVGLYGGKFNKNNLAYVLYNDQTYDTMARDKITDHEKDHHSHYYAHAKGNIAFDANGGFWMVHSAPGFPFNHTISTTSWLFPTSQSVYAQTFFCVNIPNSAINNIAGLLQYHYPYIYDSNLPAHMATTFPTFKALIEAGRITGSSSITFSSRGGKSFTAISKSFDTDSDLYEDYVAPKLNVPLKVETWCGGKFGNQCTPSYCKGTKIVNPSTPQKSQSAYAYDIANINKMNFGTGLEFQTSNNHGKWGIAYKKGSSSVSNWFCASDINLMTTQRHRGGGALCMIDNALWTALNNQVISDYDKKCE